MNVTMLIGPIMQFDLAAFGHLLYARAYTRSYNFNVGLRGAKRLDLAFGKVARTNDHCGSRCQLQKQGKETHCLTSGIRRRMTVWRRIPFHRGR